MTKEQKIKLLRFYSGSSLIFFIMILILSIAFILFKLSLFNFCMLVLLLYIIYSLMTFTSIKKMLIGLSDEEN
jgi:uncharacterized protein (DUF983 family)